MALDMTYFEEMEAKIPKGKVRTRFAPSPTGYMHVGNLRTALYTWLIARHNQGTFILRIEDTDQTRQVEGATEVIYRTLAECHLDHDEGPDVGGPVAPYIQTERRDTYGKYARLLVEKGHAYYCFCEKAESEEDSGEFDRAEDPCRALSPAEAQARVDAGEPYVIRQKIPAEGSTTFHDAIFGDITVENKTLDDQVLIKRDGLPTYNFANVIDDHLMGITHVVRGSEYLSSAPKYDLLYQAFGWKVPTYVHCSPVMRDAQHKMSKRHGDPSYEDLKAQGFLTDAILNYVALLGWSPKGDLAEQEIFTLDQLVDEMCIRDRLYSVVDRMYIGNIAQVGSLALAGAGVCGPIVTMLGSVAFWVGVGGSPLISIRMGEGRQEEARRVLANCFLLLIGLALALTGLAYATRRPALLLFGASPETLPYAMDYYSCYLTGTVFALLSTGMNQFIICQGFAKKGMQSVMLGAVLRCV